MVHAIILKFYVDRYYAFALHTVFSTLSCPKTVSPKNGLSLSVIVKLQIYRLSQQQNINRKNAFYVTLMYNKDYKIRNGKKCNHGIGIQRAKDEFHRLFTQFFFLFTDHDLRTDPDSRRIKNRFDLK